MNQKRLTLIAAIVIGVSVGLSVFTHGLNSKSIEDRLVETSKNLNARLPMPVDSETRWDTTIAGPGACLTYCYTLINISKSDIDPNNLTTLMRPKLVEAYKTNPEMKVLKDNRVTLRYTYKDKSGAEITTIQVAPEDI